MRDLEEELEHLRFIFWLRVFIVMALMMGAMGVLSSFIGLIAHLAYITNTIDPAAYPELGAAFEEINQAPISYMFFNLYNIILWNGVIISGIWLFRYYGWARKSLVFFLGLDMIVTVLTLIWRLAFGTPVIHNPAWFMILNTIQVVTIIGLSHPNLIEKIESMSKDKQAERSLEKLRQTLREKGDKDSR